MRHPFEMLKRRGHRTRIIEVRDNMAWSPSWFVGEDVVVIQRQADVRFLEMLRMVPHLAVVCEFDDALWMLKGNEHSLETRRGWMQMIRGCDGVTVSTPELARAVGVLTEAAIYTIPNAIDFGLRDWTNRPTSRPAGYSVVIGWAGSIRGDDDFAPLGDALRRVLADHPEACFAIGGDPEENAKHCLALGLPDTEQVRVLPAAPFPSYPQLIGHFDVGLAPLAVHAANACKSELKLMEYGAWGIPYVASEIAPYRRFHDRTGRTGGYLCQTPNQWRLALEALVSDEDRRQTMGASLRQAVRDGYSLEDTADRWEAALMAVCRQREKVSV